MAGVSSPWVPVEPLTKAAFATFRRRAIFTCHKWDPQVGDHCVLARHPLVIEASAWAEVARLAEQLATETLALEQELTRRPDLHRRLGLPFLVRRALAEASRRPPVSLARIMRFDFHYTTDGWRISEANTDVPGGLNEASGFPALVAPLYARTRAAGDPAAAYAGAIRARLPAQATVALVHATAYSDDQQMMTCVAHALAAMGVTARLASPSHLRWRDGHALLALAGSETPLDAIVRFFPAEWLPGLAAESGWTSLFGGTSTPLSNPATALLVQSKRLPLVWQELDAPAPTWRALLPETRNTRDVPWRTSDAWVVKPALGRVGEGVGLRHDIEPKEWTRIRRSATVFPRSWIAQRRFDVVPLRVGGTPYYPCLGVYTVDSAAVGAYGRVAPRPLIDARAADAAVLVAA